MGVVRQLQGKQAVSRDLLGCNGQYFIHIQWQTGWLDEICGCLDLNSC
jgi:hypothetical protein